MKRDQQLNLRLTLKQKNDLKKQAKIRGITITSYVLGCIYNSYIQETEPVKLKSLSPPPVTAFLPHKIEVLPRSTKGDFLKEIREVFKNKGIFVN